MAWISVAVVVLVAITVSGDDQPSNAGAATSSAERTDGAADAATSVSNPDTTTSVSSTGSDTPSASTTTPGADAAATTTSPTTTSTASAVTPPPTTIGVTAPPTTTLVVTAPTTTIVVAAPTTTLVVTAPTTTAAPTTATTTPPVAATGDCAVLGTDDFGDVRIELSVVSPTTAVALVEVGFVLNDRVGAEIVSDFLLLEFMAPGEIARLATETFEPVPPGNDVSSLSCVIDTVEVIELFEDQRLPGPDDTCSVLGVDDVGDVQLTATVRNPTSEAADLIFTYAVRDAQGVRVISDAGFADGLAAGQVATQEVDTLTAPPPDVDVATLTCDIVGLELF